jgi:hypothetical protein
MSTISHLMQQETRDMATLQEALEKRGFAEAARAARLIDGLTNTDEQRACLAACVGRLARSTG